jgi:hypothetical protein
MDIIERAARNLRQVSLIKDGQIVNATEVVRTILAELREPSREMVAAASVTEYGYSQEAWQAMIDVARR